MQLPGDRDNIVRDKGTIDFAGLSAHLMVAFLELLLASSASVVNRAWELTGGQDAVRGRASICTGAPVVRTARGGRLLLSPAAPQHKGWG